MRFEILNTEMAFLIYSPYHDFTIYTEETGGRQPWWRRDVDGLVDEFARAIREDREPAITGEDARAALAIALTAYESARTGRVARFLEEGLAAGGVKG